MVVFTPYLAALRRQDLLDEAESRRSVRLAGGAQSSVAAWRRGLGSGALGLSGLLASAAASLDPTAEVENPNHKSADGSGARVMAA